MATQLHPDMNHQDPQNHDKFVALNEAYTVLSKPGSRREYDMNLAVRLHMQRQARNASSSHVHGSSAWPGSSAGPQRDADSQRFWDETIFHMRDQSKDAEYEGQPYYGFTNMKRVSNLDILLGCFALMTAGALLHYFAIRKSTSMHKVVLDEKDKLFHSNLVKARTYAKTHGNALQLQILKSKVTKTPLDLEGLAGVTEETVRDTFSGVKKS